MKILTESHPRYHTSAKCSSCSGTGRHLGCFGKFVPNCPRCNGSGWEDGQFRMLPTTKDQKEYLERLREKERNPDMNIRFGVA